MTTENQNLNLKQPQVAPKLDEFPSWLAYSIECRRVGVIPVPNPDAEVPQDRTGIVTLVPNPDTPNLSVPMRSPVPSPITHEQSPRIQDSPVVSTTPIRTLGFDPRTVEPFDGWTSEQIRTVAVYHWDYLPIFSKEKASWWAENAKSVDFFKRNFHKMAEAIPTKLTLKQMEYAVAKATAPPMEYDYNSNCSHGCRKGLIWKLEGRLWKIKSICECRHLVPMGTATWRKQT